MDNLAGAACVATGGRRLHIAGTVFAAQAMHLGRRIMLSYKAMYKDLTEGVHAEVLDFPDLRLDWRPAPEFCLITVNTSLESIKTRR